MKALFLLCGVLVCGVAIATDPSFDYFSDSKFSTDCEKPISLFLSAEDGSLFFGDGDTSTPVGSVDDCARSLQSCSDLFDKPEHFAKGKNEMKILFVHHVISRVPQQHTLRPQTLQFFEILKKNRQEVLSNLLSKLKSQISKGGKAEASTEFAVKLILADSSRLPDDISMEEAPELFDTLNSVLHISMEALSKGLVEVQFGTEKNEVGKIIKDHDINRFLDVLQLPNNSENIFHHFFSKRLEPTGSLKREFSEDLVELSKSFAAVYGEESPYNPSTSMEEQIEWTFATKMSFIFSMRFDFGVRDQLTLHVLYPLIIFVGAISRSLVRLECVESEVREFETKFEIFDRLKRLLGEVDKPSKPNGLLGGTHPEFDISFVYAVFTLVEYVGDESAQKILKIEHIIPKLFALALRYHLYAGDREDGEVLLVKDSILSFLINYQRDELLTVHYLDIFTCAKTMKTIAVGLGPKKYYLMALGGAMHHAISKSSAHDIEKTLGFTIFPELEMALNYLHKLRMMYSTDHEEDDCRAAIVKYESHSDEFNAGYVSERLEQVWEIFPRCIKVFLGGCIALIENWKLFEINLWEALCAANAMKNLETIKSNRLKALLSFVECYGYYESHFGSKTGKMESLRDSLLLKMSDSSTLKNLKKKWKSYQSREISSGSVGEIIESTCGFKLDPRKSVDETFEELLEMQASVPLHAIKNAPSFQEILKRKGSELFMRVLDVLDKLQRKEDIPEDVIKNIGIEINNILIATILFGKTPAVNPAPTPASTPPSINEIQCVSKMCALFIDRLASVIDHATQAFYRMYPEYLDEDFLSIRTDEYGYNNVPGANMNLSFEESTQKIRELLEKISKSLIDKAEENHEKKKRDNTVHFKSALYLLIESHTGRYLHQRRGPEVGSQVLHLFETFLTFWDNKSRDLFDWKDESVDLMLILFCRKYDLAVKKTLRNPAIIQKIISASKHKKNEPMIRKMYILLLICLQHSPKKGELVARALAMRERIHQQANVPKYICSLEDIFFSRSHAKIIKQNSSTAVMSFITKRSNALMSVITDVSCSGSQEKHHASTLFEIYSKFEEPAQLNSSPREYLRKRFIEDAEKFYSKTEKEYPSSDLSME